ncbi:phage integrase [Lyngbya sp. PCC 8106]|uniref:phage integrase n=1 Tax=Lyngbya sp. (strain PCC 8106) TaxID=313612 RepID=UPI0000EAB653|nr:phage integrase [Lyngbya sp. PCC 8106]EAW36013.1 Phage integrase [Lyngbya sp. PCC 8106]
MQPTFTATLALSAPLPLTLHPAAVYLRSLGSGSRPTMKQSLDAIASILTNGECDADTLDWAALRYQHTAAVQAVLLERHAPVTVKKMIAALRRVLQEARKLKLMDAESYSTAVVKLGLQDFTPETGALSIRQGKGGKDRTVYLPDNAIAWVEKRSKG